MTRQQRRQMIRKEAKKYIQPDTPQTQEKSSFITPDQFQLIVQDLQRLLNYIKVVDNHVWAIVETMSMKGILKWEDVNQTENLYLIRDKNRKEKIKELLAEDKTVPEYLEAIKEDPNLPGYEKFNIHPIKDLNLNPYEIGAYLKELYPDLTEQEYIGLRKDWNLNGEHFGFKKQEP